MRQIILFLIPLLAAAPAVKAQSNPKAAAKMTAGAAPAFGNADAITQEELKIYLYFLASDPMEGRNLPSRGFDTAALYIASRLAEWGLKPGGSASGNNRSSRTIFNAIRAGHQAGGCRCDEGFPHRAGSPWRPRRRRRKRPGSWSKC